MSDFIRNVRVTIAKPLPKEFFKTNPLNAVVIEELKVVFKVVKSLKPEPNSCEIAIHNLNESSRSEFAKLPLRIRLDGGYDGRFERVFEGDLRWSKSKHDGTEWITSLECGDGDRAYRFATVSKSFRPGADPKMLIAEVAKTMGLEVPSNVAGAKALVKKFASGVSLDGNSRDEMTKLLKRSGMGWSVQDGKLQILGTEALETSAIVISGNAETGDETGMIGAPEISAPAKPGALPTLKLKHTLFPDLQPGRKISVRAAAIKGLFRVVQLTHVGDTHGADWYTEIEANPL